MCRQHRRRWNGQNAAYGVSDKVIAESVECAKNFMTLEKNDKVIITGGFPSTGVTKTTNLMKIEEI